MVVIAFVGHVTCTIMHEIHGYKTFQPLDLQRTEKVSLSIWYLSIATMDIGIYSRVEKVLVSMSIPQNSWSIRSIRYASSLSTCFSNATHFPGFASRAFAPLQ